MANYKAAFMKYLDNHGVKYDDQNETIVSLSYKAENMDSVRVYVGFDSDGENLVTFKSYSIGHVKDDKLSAALVACNAMNAQFRWIKFYIDDDQDIACQCDALVDMESVGSECLQLVERMVGIMDDAYPEFMKAFWA